MRGLTFRESDSDGDWGEGYMVAYTIDGETDETLVAEIWDTAYLDVKRALGLELNYIEACLEDPDDVKRRIAAL